MQGKSSECESSSGYYDLNHLEEISTIAAEKIKTKKEGEKDILPRKKWHRQNNTVCIEEKCNKGCFSTNVYGK